MDAATERKGAHRNIMILNTISAHSEKPVDRKNTLSSDPHEIRVISITSGKGGVGKSNIVLNLALIFEKMALRVLIMDTNMGLSNIDILSGVQPRYNISHLLTGEKKLQDILLQGPGNIHILAANVGMREFCHLKAEQKLFLLDVFDNWRPEFDILLIDTAPGISDNVLYFNIAAQEKVVVITPEPTSVEDAATLINILRNDYYEKHFKIVVNGTKNAREGRDVFVGLSNTVDQKVGSVSLDYLGYVPFDPNISEAVKQQKPVVLAFPGTPASHKLMILGRKLASSSTPPANGNIKFFWRRFLNV